MKKKLSSGTMYGYDSNGNKICTGSQMGRRNFLPQDLNTPIKLEVQRLKWVDGDYDEGGAYWGGGNGDTIFFFHGEDSEEQIELYVRAKSMKQATEKMKEILPNATFELA